MIRKALNSILKRVRGQPKEPLPAISESDDEMTRLEAELDTIEQLIATEETRALPSAQGEARLASLKKQAKDLRAQIAVAGSVTDSAVTIGDKNLSVQGIQANQGGVVIVSRGDVVYTTPKEELSPPFMAPKPLKQFVQRPAESEALIERLRARGSQRTVAITTALQGGGGFGKTTLAQAICHDERIYEAFPDGILWVTIGQTPSLAELLVNQIKLFAPAETYTDINAATARLRTLLTGKRVLVVLDDVWPIAHAPLCSKIAPLAPT